MSLSVLKQGAEARLYIGEYKGVKCIVKERFVKKYRHPLLDSQISKQRIKAESKAAARCLSAGILAAEIYQVNLNERKIYIQYFEEAITAKQYIQQITKEYSEEESKIQIGALCVRIGVIIAKMHANNIIHGDLTTSNILINPKENGSLKEYDVILIDFGLSHYNQGPEDKGVDLYVLERALLSTHSEQKYLFDTILQAYRQECGEGSLSVMSKFEEVRLRGRKRTMIG